MEMCETKGKDENEGKRGFSKGNDGMMGN